VKVTRAYRFALDPSRAKERALRSHAGAARFAWNWGLARCLERYAAWNSGNLVLAGRFYPSSKTCSGCGAVKAKLALSERTYRCDVCGLVLDRDVNAACSLLNLAVSGTESRNACRAWARPVSDGRRAQSRPGRKQEPGTAHAGKTGTAGPQGSAASHGLSRVR